MCKKRTGLPSFTSPAQMDKKIKSYFNSLQRSDKKPSVAGLCVHLGVVRQTLLNYQEKEEYKEIIEFAKLKIEEEMVNNLLDPTRKNVSGIIFMLKNNFKWTDGDDWKKELELAKLELEKIKLENNLK